jgi:predicted ArsR family transcriptional regulator
MSSPRVAGEQVPGSSDIELERPLRSIDELQVLSDALRASIRALLSDRELTIKELSGLLNVPAYRLYHHMNELERVGLIRVVRTEVAGGPAQRYYRATSKYIDVPFELLHGDAGEELAKAASHFQVERVAASLAVLRHVLIDEIDRLDPDVFTVERGDVRTSSERARAFAQQLAELFREFQAMEEGETEGSVRLTLTATLIPHETVYFVPEVEIDGRSEQDDENQS